MRFFDGFIAVASLTVFVLFGWWSVYAAPFGAGALEERLKSNVETALAEQAIPADVTIDGQVAILTGPSLSEADEVEAIATALTAAGPGGPWLGGISAVKARFDEAVAISPYVWRAIKTRDGAIVMSGHAPDTETIDQLARAAEQYAPGGVDNLVEIGAGAPDGDWSSVAGLALSGLGRIDSGAAELVDTRLSLSGMAMDEDVRATVSAEIANAPPPFFGAPELRGVGLWYARHLPDALLLGGRVDSEADKARILGIARANYGGEVRDEMVVGGNDYQDWLQGVELGLPHFSNFQSGDMAFDPEGEGFRFDGEASGSTLAYLREDMATYDGPYDVTFEAETVIVDVDEIADIDFSGDAAGACEGAFDAVLATNSVVFELGSAEISRDSGETLDKLMTVAGLCDERLQIELGGHTDNAGDRAYNLYLSEERARAVAEYMSSAGFDASRLLVKGYGPDAPKADNATREGRAANRRLEFRIKDGSED